MRAGFRNATKQIFRFCKTLKGIAKKALKKTNAKIFALSHVFACRVISLQLTHTKLLIALDHTSIKTCSIRALKFSKSNFSNEKSQFPKKNNGPLEADFWSHQSATWKPFNCCRADNTQNHEHIFFSQLSWLKKRSFESEKPVNIFLKVRNHLNKR